MKLRPSRFSHGLGFLSKSRIGQSAFSLIELLTVMGFISILTALTVPAINGLKSSGEFSKGVDEVAMTLNRARAHAIAQNTYVWVGFFEESSMSVAVADQVPPFTGKGRVVMATVASKDGTTIFENGASGSMLPSVRLSPVGRVTKISSMHLSDVGSPSGGDERKLDGRPATPYTDSDSASCRISSTSGAKTPFPFQTGGYTFYKTIRFSPSGEATINGSPQPRRLGEIGLVPTAGDVVREEQSNVAAIQFAGISGNVKTYRQ